VVEDVMGKIAERSRQSLCARPQKGPGVIGNTEEDFHAMFFQAVDLGTLVGEVIRELGPDTAGRKIEWRTGDLPTVSADASLLRMVLVNLIANALKYTRPRDQADIEIGCQAGEKETIFFIRDNGVGFDMAYVDKLFGVFQRLHSAEEFEGTGIGLANVRRIINRHGGRTWAEGKPDQGASFSFTLPRRSLPAKGALEDDFPDPRSAPGR
jgi:light-regulated signal transduction histidine kinase (bacteriophytochrome)